MRAYKQYEVLLIIEYAYAAYEKPERGPAYTVLTHAESARAAIEKVQKASMQPLAATVAHGRAAAERLSACAHQSAIDLFTVTGKQLKRDEGLRREWCQDCGATRIVQGLGEESSDDAPWVLPEYVRQTLEDAT